MLQKLVFLSLRNCITTQRVRLGVGSYQEKLLTVIDNFCCCIINNFSYGVIDNFSYSFTDNFGHHIIDNFSDQWLINNFFKLLITELKCAAYDWLQF